MTPPPLPDLEELRAQREQIRCCVADAGETLNWLAEHFSHSGGIPLYVWHRRDQPFGRKSRTLGLAFDLWHAILRAERTLRVTRPPLSARLQRAAEDVHQKLIGLTEVGDGDDLRAYGHRIGSDEIYGTFNALSAAAVLRAEIFPKRFPATPSYLAGHVLVAELRLARETANAYRVGAGAPFPRMAVVSQAVHSLMLYVEHLRKRASLFSRIREEIEGLQALKDVVDAMPPAAGAMIHVGAIALAGADAAPPEPGAVPALDAIPPVAEAVPPPVDAISPQVEPISAGVDATPLRVDCPGTLWNGYLRIAMARLASACEECASLLLATHRFFDRWREHLENRAREDDEPVRWEHLEQTLADALVEVKKAFSRPDPNEPQQVARQHAADFCRELSDQYTRVHRALAAALAIDPKAGYRTRVGHLENLRQGLDALTHTMLGDTPRGECPSIVDAARYQFARELVDRFCDRGGRLYSAADLRGAEARNRLGSSLRVLNQTYSLGIDELKEDHLPHNLAGCACKVLRALGDSRLGQHVLGWWERRMRCYAYPSPGRKDWITLRHRSFEAIVHLRKGLAKSRNVADAARALGRAAEEETRVADEIAALVKELTDWCSLLGHQLLLSGRGGPAGGADAHELASALWIAERIGEPWSERLEEEALAAIAGLQLPDGSFGTVAPLYQNRGFAFYLPTASTIAVLARFATGGTQAPHTPRLRARLRRWAPVLIRGARFLTGTMVGHDPATRDAAGLTGLAGWHSDRHPEAERIDCMPTSEAVTALCRLDDALKWLINLEAAGEFRVDWPAPLWATARPTDLEQGPRQLLLKVAQLIGWHRAQNDPYKVAPQLGIRYHDDVVAHYAFVLFGPPGTGKTHFQSILAGELGWPLVTLTIGDFLHDGEDRLGRRAVDVFRRLSFLSNACIVFDEFDEMVADRGKGGPGLPLLTAAILPLLANLREEAKNNGCLVTFTTNYMENIDRAAIRGGRVDEPILLMYPDYHSRLLLGLIRAARPCKEGDGRPAVVDWKRLASAAQDTAMCAYPDVVSYLGRVLGGAGGAGKPQAPKPAIDGGYYGDLERPDDRLKETLEALWKSIGPREVQDRWLETHTEWRKLQALFAPAPVAVPKIADVTLEPETV